MTGPLPIGVYDGAASGPSPRAPLAPSRSPAAAPATLDFALLRGALEEIPFGVATTRGGTILYANEALSRIYGVPQGALENMEVSALFNEETFAHIEERLAEFRCFDGRVATRGFDGRSIDAELHVEWYSSEAQGVGGFLILRDVTTELGALGRLVDQLGGALFRVRVPEIAIEMVSPSISKLTGVDAATCILHPVVLTALVSAEERERMLFLYRRLTRGEMAVASAQMSIKRQDGTARVLQVRATCRRDTNGVVRYIDGVLTDAAREADAPTEPPPPAPEPRPQKRAPADPDGNRDPVAGAAMELSHELLREAGQLVHALGRELRGLRAAMKAAGLPPETLTDLSARVDAASAVSSGALALNRGVRRVLARATFGAPLSEVLDNVRATLIPVLMAGDRAVALDPGDAANVVIPERAEELGAALVYLSLRAFRFAGSGTLRIAAHRTEASVATGSPFVAPHDLRPRGRASQSRQERTHLVLEIVGAAPADLADTSVEISSDVLRAVPRPPEADLAYQAAQALLGSVGGAIESDDATFSTARTVIRLRV